MMTDKWYQIRALAFPTPERGENEADYALRVLLDGYELNTANSAYIGIDFNKLINFLRRRDIFFSTKVDYVTDPVTKRRLRTSIAYMTESHRSANKLKLNGGR